MPSLNFVRSLAPKVRAGEKLCTIRAKRKRAWKVGDRAVCYTGLRTRSVEKLCESTVEKVRDIRMSLLKKTRRAGVFTLRILKVVVDGHNLSLPEINDLAKQDGFTSWVDLYFFFAKKLPFHGDWIFWKPEPQPETPFRLIPQQTPTGRRIRVVYGCLPDKHPCPSPRKSKSSRRKRTT